MSETNAFIGRTYFEGDSGIAVPPEYFLQRIYDYDPLLVVFPSQRQPGAYVLARRREQTAGLTGKVVDMITQPDTKTCIAMGWIPVCTFFQTGISWDPTLIIGKLMARDIREQGGADKVADRLEEEEDAATAATRQATRDDLYNRSGDAWRSYQARTGQNSLLPHGELPRKEVADYKTLPPLEAPQDLGMAASTAV